MCIHIILLYTPLAFAGLELRQPFCFFFYIIIICLAIVDGEHYTSTLSSSCIIYVFTCIAYYSYTNLNIKSCIERQKKKTYYRTLYAAVRPQSEMRTTFFIHGNDTNNIIYAYTLRPRKILYYNIPPRFAPVCCCIQMRLASRPSKTR